jgi:very-short-patch-repair endonuclease
LLVTRDQALAAGVSREAIRRYLRSRAWEAMHRCVYRLETARPATPEQAMLAVCLSLPGGVVSHLSAAWLWSLEDTWPGMVDVIAGRPGLRREGAVIHWARDRLGLAVSRRRGIPVTNPLRTLLDVARMVPPDQLAGITERAVAKGLVSGEGILAELERKGRSGVVGGAALRSVLSELGVPGVPASQLERRLLQIIRSFGLPVPVRELRVGGRHQYRADVAWLQARLLVEVDGFATHGTPEALQADLARQNELVRQGWRVLRYTWADLRDRPGQVAAEIAAVLMAAA